MNTFRNGFLAALVASGLIYILPADACPQHDKIKASATGRTYLKAIDARQTRIKTKIEAGLSNGTLTTREAVKLSTRARKIGDLEFQLISDGVLSRMDYLKLMSELDKLSRSVSRDIADRNRVYL